MQLLFFASEKRMDFFFSFFIRLLFLIFELKVVKKFFVLSESQKKNGNFFGSR